MWVNKERGSTLVMVMMFTLILTILGTAMLGITINEYRMERVHRDGVVAYYLAEAGLEKALYEITMMDSITIDSAWEMGAEDRNLLQQGVEGHFQVIAKEIDLEQIIYKDLEEEQVYKRVYKITLHSLASVNRISREIEVEARIEKYEDSGVENKVEIRSWRQIR